MTFLFYLLFATSSFAMESPDKSQKAHPLQDTESQDVLEEAAQISIAGKKYLQEVLKEKDLDKFVERFNLKDEQNPFTKLTQNLSCETKQVPIQDPQNEPFESYVYLFQSKDPKVRSNGKVIFYVSGDQSFFLNPFTFGDDLKAIHGQVKDLNLAEFMDQDVTWINLPAIYYFTQKGFKVIALNHPTQYVNGPRALSHKEVKSETKMFKCTNKCTSTNFEGKDTTGSRSLTQGDPYTSIVSQIKAITEDPKKYGLDQNDKYVFWGHSRGSLIGGLILEDPDLSSSFISYNLCGATDGTNQDFQKALNATKVPVNIIQGTYDLMARSPGIFQMLKIVHNPKVQIYMPIAEHSFHAGSIWNHLKTQQKIDEKKAVRIAKDAYVKFLHLIATNELPKEEPDFQTKILQNSDAKSGKILAFFKAFPEHKEQGMKKLLEIGKFDVYVDLLKSDPDLFPNQFFDFLINLKELPSMVDQAISALENDKNKLNELKEEKISPENFTAASALTKTILNSSSEKTIILEKIESALGFVKNIKDLQASNPLEKIENWRKLSDILIKELPELAPSFLFKLKDALSKEQIEKLKKFLEIWEAFKKDYGEKIGEEKFKNYENRLFMGVF